VAALNAKSLTITEDEEEVLHEALDRPSELLQILPPGLISGMSSPTPSTDKQNKPDGGSNE
jgi:hypothetical protein